MSVRAIRLELKPCSDRSDEEGIPVRIPGAVHVRKLTGELDDEAFGLHLGLSRDKTVSRGLYSGRVFAAEERKAKSNRFLNEIGLNHAIRSLALDE
jgi:hypothetical protein